ncbi:hypothetical protein CkaCkLH20_08818 [Colletotrichum karsti]|uniref:DUF7053 domain-containing protein n=1 Tax=Colletotrichum karsti TaxID=1095194 RepID=A0A9P6HZF8_9PEZI|nr:uncharacterized protein CkaCkLH20_08818 [Colletotrichum karsti]KAF9873708.1 hypothetical protein CkaCkLH20_08818 [Colletotrichum karsti]
MFETTFTLKHTTPVPPRMSREHVLSLLHDPEHHIKCDPNMKTFIGTTPKVLSELPDDVTPLAPTVCYSVTDAVPTPVLSKVWERESDSHYQFTFTADGCFVHTDCPLGVVLETRWTVRDAKDGGLELEEVAEVKCSKLWASLVRGQLEKNWKDYHKAFLEI